MESYKVLGLMSGSSMDGLDVAHCEITVDDGKWSYKILRAECIPYPAKWKLRLEKLVLQNAITYIKTHTYLGHYMGERTREFIDRHGIENEVDFIASHGQTIFHQPDNNFTSQIGDGAAMAMRTGLPVICDFRTADVAFNGQGTPVAPIVDKLLFSDYKYLLNLGGISNITVNTGDKYIAFDITAVNLIMNKLVGKIGKEYDEDGNMARSGKLNEELLTELNGSWYYEKEYPKSLSGGWVSKVMYPVANRQKIPIEDKLRTLAEHIALQHANSIKMIQQKEGIEVSADDKMLLTGGGAFNKFLVECIQEKVPMTLEVADAETVEFKESLLMALMGVLRVRNEVNCLSSVTGADQDTIGGTIYQGSKKMIKSVLA